MKKSKLLIASIAMASVCLLSSVIALTGAWFTHTSDVETATITVGDAVTLTIQGTFGNETVLPGDTVENFVSAYAKAADVSSSMYVRAQISTTGEVGEYIDVTSAGTDWVEYGDYFYYATETDTLSSTSKLGDLTVLNQASQTTNLDIDIAVLNTATEETLVPGTTVTFNIVFQAIQSKNTQDKLIDDMVDKWGDGAGNVGGGEDVEINNPELGTASYEINGDEITLKAKPNDGATLLGFKKSNGEFISNISNLEILGAMLLPLQLGTLTDQDVSNKIMVKMENIFSDITFTQEELDLIVKAYEDAATAQSKTVNELLIEFGNQLGGIDIVRGYNALLSQEIALTDDYSGETYTAVFTNSVPTITESADEYGLTYAVYQDAQVALVESSVNGVVNIPENYLENIVVGVNRTISDDSKIIFTNAISVTIPKTFSIIQDFMFRGADTVQSLTLPNTIKSIGSNAINGCDGLTSITIPASVESIGDYAFGLNGTYGCCDKLEEVIFEQGSRLKIIGKNAFASTKIKNITIPASVKLISEFWGFRTLETVTFSDTSNWYVADDAKGTNQLSISVTDPSINATNLKVSGSWGGKYLIKK